MSPEAIRWPIDRTQATKVQYNQDMLTELDFMDEYAYLGAVCQNNGWRFFYDEGSRYKWGLDFKNADASVIPQQRNQSLVINHSNIGEYFNGFDREVSSVQIKEMPHKIPLTFVVNFDQHLFVDGGGEAGEHLPISDFVPEGWKLIVVRDPYFYVPSTVRELWVNKHLIVVDDPPVEKVGIYRWTYVGAVRYRSKWEFFYEQFGMWMLDFESFMEKGNRPDWPTDPIYGDWRVNLPKVDETNAEDYLQYMETRKLEHDEIPKLMYILPKLELEFTSEEERDYWAEIKPELDFIIDFDARLYVQRAYDAAQIALNVDPKVKFAPGHWTCHQDNPYKYIPAQLRSLWGES